jgi:hypothetical protein
MLAAARGELDAAVDAALRALIEHDRGYRRAIDAVRTPGLQSWPLRA